MNKMEDLWQINSVEETTTTTDAYADSDIEDPEFDYPEFDFNVSQTVLKVPFPEAGIDIVDVNMSSLLKDEEVCGQSAIKWTDSHNWEENWLFKKRKRTDSKANITYGYMAMTLAELSVLMLIPNPCQKVKPLIGNQDIDELSEMSEHNSVGSLEFSEDESEYESDVQIQKQITNKDSKTTDNTDTNNICNNNNITGINKTNTNNNNNNNNEIKVLKRKIIGNNSKPNVLSKVPNFLPKQLRTNEISGESDPHFTLRPGDACVQSGIIVQFCCRAKGTKPLLFSWFKNDTLLKSDLNFRIFQSGDQNILEIKKTSVEYSAQYSCVVYNSYGYQWCDFTLEVRDSGVANIATKPNQKHRNPIESKITNNSKHEIHEKSYPLVIQRTWAQRVAELQNTNSNSRFENFETMPSNHTNNVEENDNRNNRDISIPTLISGTIAEREHKKWETDAIDWTDNPYTIERLNSRIQQKTLGLDSELLTKQTEDINGGEEDISFLSSNSKDLSRYQKEYYVTQALNKEETLRSYEENEYSNSKYFDLNDVKTNEFMRKRSSKSSEDMSQISEVWTDKNSNETETELQFSDSDHMLPSVKDLVYKFSSDSEQNDKIPKLVDIKRKNSFSNEKINNYSKNLIQSQMNFKVHSLTARSMTKEFRQLSQLNIPRPQNRMAINSQNKTVSVESESSSPSTTCSPTNEGYASDESNTSSVSNRNLSVAIQQNKANSERKFSRSILKRAEYWEKRCERGLISDNTVSEGFPPMENTEANTEQ